MLISCGVVIPVFDKKGIQMLLVLLYYILELVFDEFVISITVSRTLFLVKLRLDEFKNLLTVEAQPGQDWPTEIPQFIHLFLVVITLFL